MAGCFGVCIRDISLHCMANGKKFEFRQFSLSQDHCAMPIGTDGVLLGAWARPDESDAKTMILDVGCGCGLIGLMLAQRYPNANIIGIDIDSEAVSTATNNALLSPFCSRVKFYKCDIMQPDSRLLEQKFDLIVSNPPFFSNGVCAPDTKRAQARHQSEGFGIDSLMDVAFSSLLGENASLALVTPFDQLDRMRLHAVKSGFELSRLTSVCTKEGKSPKRCLTQWRRVDLSALPVSDQPLCILDKNGCYSDQYKTLTEEFYLPSHFDKK